MNEVRVTTVYESIITVNDRGLYLDSKCALSPNQILGINEYVIEKHINASGNNEYRLSIGDCLLGINNYVIGYFDSIMKANKVIESLDKLQYIEIKKMIEEKNEAQKESS